MANCCVWFAHEYNSTKLMERALIMFEALSAVPNLGKDGSSMSLSPRSKSTISAMLAPV